MLHQAGFLSPEQCSRFQAARSISVTLHAIQRLFHSQHLRFLPISCLLDRLRLQVIFFQRCEHVFVRRKKKKIQHICCSSAPHIAPFCLRGFYSEGDSMCFHSANGVITMFVAASTSRVLHQNMALVLNLQNCLTQLYAIG